MNVKGYRDNVTVPSIRLTRSTKNGSYALSLAYLFQAFRFSVVVRAPIWTLLGLRYVDTHASALLFPS